jgi:hypothetical protein
MINLDLVIEYIEANQFEENQPEYVHGKPEHNYVIETEDLVKYIESLKENNPQ